MKKLATIAAFAALSLGAIAPAPVLAATTVTQDQEFVTLLLNYLGDQLSYYGALNSALEEILGPNSELMAQINAAFGDLQTSMSLLSDYLGDAVTTA